MRLLAAALVWLALASPARAWTETSVESVTAHVDVIGARALVSIELGLRVHGGWLLDFELRGLEPDLALDPRKPAFLVYEDGRKLTPTTSQKRGGRLIFAFGDKRSAPRRGRHRLGFVYEATLARTTDGHTSFSLPAFMSDLKEARIELRAPAPVNPSAPDGEALGTIEVLTQGSTALIRARAQHVPRGMPLEIAFSAQRTEAAVRAPSTATEVGLVPRRDITLAALLVIALCAWKRSSVRRTARVHAALALPLLALPSSLRVLGSVAAAALYAVLHTSERTLALLAVVACVALALDRGFVRSPARPLPWPRGPAFALAWRRARRVRHARLLGAAAWLDVTTPAGALLLASCYTLALTRCALLGEPDAWLEALLAVTPLFFSATRLQLPRSRHDALLAHLDASRALPRRRARRAAERVGARKEIPSAVPHAERSLRSDPRKGGAPTALPAGREGRVTLPVT